MLVVKRVGGVVFSTMAARLSDAALLGSPVCSCGMPIIGWVSEKERGTPLMVSLKDVQQEDELAGNPTL